jgi:hypothetical protein
MHFCSFLQIRIILIYSPIEEFGFFDLAMLLGAAPVDGGNT